MVDGRPFDIKINNILIEFNGTYWHLDNRIYNSDYYDKCRKITASEQWKRDEFKLKIAKKNGYSTITVWQYDWERDYNVELNRIIKIINNERKIQRNL